MAKRVTDPRIVRMRAMIALAEEWPRAEEASRKARARTSACFDKRDAICDAAESEAERKALLEMLVPVDQPMVDQDTEQKGSP